MMLKQELNPIRIGKGAFSLLAMFVMLLAPQRAWAQTDYGLTVAGVAVTSENASSITGDEITAGSVSFDATTNTLTLNTASLNGHIVWDNTTDLTIHLVGECSVYGSYPSSNDPVIKGNGGALLFTSSETTPGSLYVGRTSVMSAFASGWSNSSTPIWTVDSQGDAIDYDWWANQGCDYMTIAPNKKYDLKINGTQFCDAWYKQNTEAEYPELTITDGNTLHISTKTDYAITSNMPALTVAVMGNASLSSIRFEATGQVTSGTLTITKDSESDYSMNSLSLKNTKDNLATMSGFSTVEFNSPMTLKTPSEAPTWDSYTGDVFVSDFVSYGITVNGVIVGEPNAADVLDDNTVSFDAQTNTLTLTNLDVYNSSSGEPFIKNGRGNLIIQLEGQSNFVWNNSVFIAKDGSASEDYTVTFTTNTDQPGNLTFRSSGNVFSTGHQVVYNNGLVLDISDLDNDYHTYDMTIQQVEYDLTVARVAVNSANASDVLGDGKVSYDRQTNKLTLNGATIQPEGEAPGIDYTGDDNLTISFSGTNSIAGGAGCSAIRYNGESQTPPTLTFESSSTSSTLTLTETSSSVIRYFGSVLGVNGINDASGNSLALTGGGVSYSAEDGLYTGADQEINPVTSATITSGYGLLVGGVLVHADNADNVLGDQNETHMVSYDPSTNTLTLTNVETQGLSTPFVESSLANGLIVKISGYSTINIPQTVSSAFKSTVANAPLTFTTDDSGAELEIVPGDATNFTLFDGFTVSYQNSLYIQTEQGTSTIRKVVAPFFYSHTEDGVTTFGFEGDNVYYSIDYVSSELQDVANVAYDPDGDDVTVLGPCTVTAYSQVGTTQSETVTAKYFGFADIETVFSPGLVLDAPTLVPATDGVQVHSYPESAGIASFNQENGKINISGVGSTVLGVNFTYTGEDFFMLNPENGVASDNPLYLAQQAVTVVPPTPTIAFDGTKTYLNTDKVTISLPESLADDQNAVIVYSWDEECQPGNANNYSDASGVPLNAGTNTLYAWVRYNGATADDALYSARVSQAFTAKTDIDQFEVTGLIETESIVYTGSAIEPTFTLYDAKDETNTLSADNYDVRIEKFVDETTGYSVVQSIVDAGIYMVYAVGKGDTYGGEKLVYEALEVTKANIQGLPTDANYYLNYNGTAQNLITVTVPEGATVMYYSKAITQEDYEDDSFELLCEVSDENFTTTVPTGTNVGYFALLYKVDGGSNYNDKRATQTIKVEIVPADITEVTLANSTLEFNGGAQEPAIASVKAGELTLTADDYDVSYNVVDGQTSNPVDAPVETGTYNAVVTGKGNFTGTQSAEFNIVYPTLDLGNVTFPQGQQWTTYYNSGYTQALPEGQNIGAFVASGVSDNEVTVAQIKYIPQGQAVLLNNATQTATENIFGQDVQGNLLLHATQDVEVNADRGDYYGLYNSAFERVKGTIPAGKNYLLVPNAVVPSGNAPKLTIVIDGIGNMTGIGHIEAIIDNENVYDLQGRKIDKPSKKGLYIMKGRKMVVK